MEHLLVTGGAGFIGSNLADRLADDGHRVVVYDAMTRPGVERNLAWLQSRHPDRIDHVQGDIRDAANLSACVREAKAVFHLAAQVAVTTSLVEPVEDLQAFQIRLQHLRQTSLCHRPLCRPLCRRCHQSRKTTLDGSQLCANARAAVVLSAAACRDPIRP